MDHFSSFENNNLPEDNQIAFDQNKSELGNLCKSSRRSWSLKEDDQLRQAIKLYGTNWLIVASALQDRNPSQCAQRWKRIKPNNLQSKRQPWTQEEDQLLLRLVQIDNKNWVQIAKKIPNRTSKQVRERFLNKLNPEINQEPFTETEDKLIVDGYKNFGSQWCKISKMLQGRPENVIKNRFYSYLRKQYLKIDNPYYVIPQQNKEFTYSNIQKRRHNKKRKMKLHNKKSKQISNLENNNEQNGTLQFKNYLNKKDKISKQSYKKIERRNTKAQNVEQSQEYFDDHKNQQIVKELSNESFDLVKEEEQQENYYYYATPNMENFEQLPANFYSNTCALNTIQPYKIIYCYSPQFGTPYIPSYFMANPIMQYGVASQETLLQKSQDIEKKHPN